MWSLFCCCCSYYTIVGQYKILHWLIIKFINIIVSYNTLILQFHMSIQTTGFVHLVLVSDIHFSHCILFSLRFYIHSTTHRASKCVFIPFFLIWYLGHKEQEVMADVVQAKCDRLRLFFCFFSSHLVCLVHVLWSTANPVSCDRHAQLQLIPTWKGFVISHRHISLGGMQKRGACLSNQKVQ